MAKSPNAFRLVACELVAVRAPTAVSAHVAPLKRRITKLAAVAPASTSPLEKLKVLLQVETAKPPPGVRVQYRLTLLFGSIPEVLIFVWSLPTVFTVRLPAVVTLREARATGV